MLSFKSLWKGEHIEIITPDKYKYEAVHEKDVIMVLPVLVIKSKFVKGLINYYLAVRKEVCPPYLIKDEGNHTYYYTTVTGQIDEGEYPEQTMKRELIEEAGIELIDYTIMSYRRNIPICKTTDMRAHIYTLLVDSFNPVKAEGDGSVTERLSETIFVKLSDMPNIIEKDNVDFLLMGGYEILMNVLPNHIKI